MKTTNRLFAGAMVSFVIAGLGIGLDWWMPLIAASAFAGVLFLGSWFGEVFDGED